MIAPLYDSRGRVRYHIGAQVDVSGLVKDCTDLESLQRLILKEQPQEQSQNGRVDESAQNKEDEFQALSEMMNMSELDTVRKWGGRMHREYQDDAAESFRVNGAHKPRLLLQETTIDTYPNFDLSDRGSGRLSGIYQNVKLKLSLKPVLC